MRIVARILVALVALMLLAYSVEALSISQLSKLTTLSAADDAGADSLVEAAAEALPDAPPGTPLDKLSSFTKKPLVNVVPTGIGKQLPGDRENNLAAIDATKFDLRHAKSIKEKVIKEAGAVIPTTDQTNTKFVNFQAKSTRLPLIAPALFNE